MKAKLSIFLVVLIMTIGLLGCGKKETQTATMEEVSSEEVTTTEEATTEEVVEDVLPQGMYRSELTNEPIDEKLKDQRPIAAMVDNELYALPHFGLNDADIVYEIMNSTKNGRITRFMVLVK